MAQSPGIGAVQIIGWTVTVTGTIVNLCWNAFNTWKASEQRKEQYRIGQWERIRSEIERRLDELVESAKLLVEQERSAGEDAVPNDILNFAVVSAQDQLASALEEAKRSRYAYGDHWVDAAFGTQQGHETSWDKVLELIAEAQAAEVKADRLAALLKIQKPVQDIRSAVLEVCRVQDLEYDPTRY